MFTDAIAAMRLSGENYLYFPSGLYKINATTIDDLNDFNLVGLGAIIQYNSGDCILKFTDCINWNISGFTFTSTASSYSDVGFLRVSVDSGFFNIRNNTFKNFPRCAIIADNLFDNGAAENKSMIINDNLFIDAANYSNDLQAAITMGSDAEYTRVLNNTFRNVPSAIRYVDGANGQFAYNQIMLCNGDAYDSNYSNGVIYCNSNGLTNTGKINILYNKINHNASGMATIVCKGDVSKPINTYSIIGNDLLINGNLTKADVIYLQDAEYSVIKENKIIGSITLVDTAIILKDSSFCSIENNLISRYNYAFEFLGSSKNIVLGFNSILEDVTNKLFISSESSVFTTDTISMQLSDLTSILSTGTDKGFLVAPFDFILNSIDFSVLEAPSGSNIVVDVNKNNSSILSTKATIDDGTNSSSDSSMPLVISDNLFNKGDKLTVDIDTATSGKGLISNIDVAKLYPYINIIQNEAVTYATNLVASWQFESNFNDYTSNHNATAIGSVTNNTTGVVGNEAVFGGGSDYLTVPNSSDFTFTDGTNDIPFSICFWIEFNSLTSNPRIMMKANSTGDKREWQIQYGNGKLTLVLWKNDGTAFLRLDRNITPSLNTRYHHAMTYDGSKLHTGLKWYENKVDVGVSSVSGTYTGMTANDRRLTIGVNDLSGNVENTLDGAMDEIKIYKNRVLTPTEIEYIYDEELIGNSVLP
jgi:parallel beta-helix repeat protein